MCIESNLVQTYEPIELVIVVDGDQALCDRIREEFAHAEEQNAEEVVIHKNDHNLGISWSRTKGAEFASGDVVAFIDDEGVAEPGWIEEHVRVYDETDAIVVACYVAPGWATEKPTFFPEEFYWLVGCTEPGFAEHLEEIQDG